MRTEIELFAQAMENTMKKYDKKKGDSWKTCDIRFLKNKLLEEVVEFLDTYHKECPESYDKKELVDIANICMMLYNRKLDIILERM